MVAPPVSLSSSHYFPTLLHRFPFRAKGHGYNLVGGGKWEKVGRRRTVASAKCSRGRVRSGSNGVGMAVALKRYVVPAHIFPRQGEEGVGGSPRIGRVHKYKRETEGRKGAVVGILAKSFPSHCNPPSSTPFTFLPLHSLL